MIFQVSMVLTKNVDVFDESIFLMLRSMIGFISIFARDISFGGKLKPSGFFEIGIIYDNMFLKRLSICYKS